MNKLFKQERYEFFKEDKPKKVKIKKLDPKDSLKLAGQMALVAGGIVVGTKLLKQIAK